jgi:UDP-N-acetylmuramoyl-L-alanyl-D-glutamate--2,6-diaminopimelate ligase
MSCAKIIIRHLEHAMRLKKILKNIECEQIRGSKDIEITGICANSKLVAPGNLFIAKKGLKGEGSRYIMEAVSAGAVGIVTDIYDPFLQNVVQIIHPDVASIEASLAENYYQHAHTQLFSVAFTGTSGKTTSTFLTKHLLDGLGKLCGIIGTVGWIVGKDTLPATHTTPDILVNHKLFYEMVQNDCKAVAMEVSSHALAQERVKGLCFDVAVFTNLSHDHLDYHLTMEDYAAAKAKLFAEHTKAAVMNADSPWTQRMMQDCRVPILTYGIQTEADVMAENLILTPRGIQCHIRYRDQFLPFSSGLIGRFNVYNYLGVIGVGLKLGVPLEKILGLLKSFKQVPGRLERVPNKANLNIFVDYSHKEDALVQVLTTLKEFKKGRLITVFGCGGDRDKLKRPKMGAAAEALSDKVIVTSDNPRTEDPEDIIRQILAGLKEPEKAIVIVDRAQAIQQAVNSANEEDVILIAGKGHETYQIFSNRTIEFDDRKVAKAATLALT